MSAGSCPACGTPAREGRRFCAHCGTALSLTCPSCSAAYEPGDRFCSECGQPLVEVPAAPGQQSVAERRLVSVLFADLVGFTGLSEQRDAEDVRELLGRYFDTARTVIGRYGGTVEKFIGDAVMAVWGAPTANEDDAERCVRAALELVTAVAAFGADVGALNLALRAGVVTGEVAVTIGATGQGMVAGDAVNTASRVQSVAPPGGVLVDDATRVSTENAIAYTEAGLHEVKGKTQPLKLWQAKHVVASVGGVIRNLALEPPFVGRSRELRVVKDTFHAASDESQAWLVSLVGPAGVGKSRVAWEFEKYIDGVSRLVRWHQGRALRYGEGVTYWALAEMVRRRFEITEEDAIAVVTQKLQAGVERYLTDPEEQQWLAPRLAHLLGVGDTASYGREDLFAAWRLFFERLSEQAPVVLVFEDMQWADDGLLDFIEYLLEWSKNFPIFILSLARPELEERRPGWPRGRRNTTVLALDPLPTEVMKELVTGLLPGLPEHLGLQILDRAEGIPLYAVETVRMLLDRGVVAARDGGYVLTTDIDDLDVPSTLQALIAARLDALSAAERRLVQDASVAGQSFTPEAVAAIGEVAIEDVRELLNALVRKEILTIQADPRSPERGQYAFLQGLVRKVAYDTLSKRDRKNRHLAAAQYYRSTWSDADEVAEVIASHYIEALNAATGQEDEPLLRAQALTMVERAAERAQSVGAPAEAGRWLILAAELAPDDVARAGYELRASRAVGMAGLGDQAREHCERALEIYEKHDLGHERARALARLGELLFFAGELHEALRLMESAYETLSDEAPDESIARLIESIARVKVFIGDPSADEPADTALKLAQEFDDPELLTMALITKNLVLVGAGRSHEALALLRHALTVSRTCNQLEVSLRAYFNLIDHAITWDLPEGRTYAEEGLALARRLGARGSEDNLISNYLELLVARGNWDEIGDWLAQMSGEARLGTYAGGGRLVAVIVVARQGEDEQAAATMESFGWQADTEDAQLRHCYYSTRSVVQFERGDFAAAYRDAQSTVSKDRHYNYGNFGAYTREAWPTLVESALRLGQLADARNAIDLIATRPAGHTPPYFRTQQSRLTALLARAEGRSDGIEAGLLTALRGFRELSLHFWIAATLLDLCEWMQSQGRGSEVAALAAEAHGLFERLGARRYLERLDTACAAMP